MVIKEGYIPPLHVGEVRWGYEVLALIIINFLDYFETFT